MVHMANRSDIWKKMAQARFVISKEDPAEVRAGAGASFLLHHVSRSLKTHRTFIFIRPNATFQQIYWISYPAICKGDVIPWSCSTSRACSIVFSFALFGIAHYSWFLVWHTFVALHMGHTRFDYSYELQRVEIVCIATCNVLNSRNQTAHRLKLFQFCMSFAITWKYSSDRSCFFCLKNASICAR